MTAPTLADALSGSLPAFVRPLAGGVHLIDTGFQRDGFDAAYLVVDRGEAAFIDTGTALAVPRMLAALDALGLTRDAVRWVIPTHVHLDHAGGAGHLMRALPAARLLIHPRGARHMIDPVALWAGATEVYGIDEMARSYGEVLPVAAERVTTSDDGMRVALGGRELLIADTPGHARHHHCIWDDATRGWFTGDCFGLSYREFDSARGPWIFPTATPVQFDPPALRQTIERLLAARPNVIYLTHFGPVGDVQRLGRELVARLDAMVGAALALRGRPDFHDAFKRAQFELFSASLRDHGCTWSDAAIAGALALDLELNAQGTAIWLAKSAA